MPTTWQRLHLISHAVMAVCFLSLQLLVGALIPPVMFFGVLFVVLFALTWKFSEKRWPYLVGAVVGVLVLVGNAPFIIEDSQHPDSFSTFAPTMVAVVAALSLAVSGLVVGLRRADSLAPRPFAMLVGGLAALVILGSVAATVMAGDDVQQDGDLLVEAKGIVYTPRVEAKTGKVTFFVNNQSRSRHTFVIADAGVHLEVPAARDRRVEVQLAPGTYTYLCDVGGHEGMGGTIEVK